MKSKHAHGDTNTDEEEIGKVKVYRGIDVGAKTRDARIDITTRSARQFLSFISAIKRLNTGIAALVYFRICLCGFRPE